MKSFKRLWKQIKNLKYDSLLEVRNWLQPAEIAIVHEVENGIVYTVEVYTEGSKFGDSFGVSRGYNCEWQVGTPTEV